jgi:hypothetical protein
MIADELVGAVYTYDGTALFNNVTFLNNVAYEVSHGSYWFI